MIYDIYIVANNDISQQHKVASVNSIDKAYAQVEYFQKENKCDALIKCAGSYIPYIKKV